MRRFRSGCRVPLGIMVLALATASVPAQGTAAGEKQAQEKLPQLSKSMILKVVKHLHPIRDGMHLISIDSGAVKVWANVKKADWAATAWMVTESQEMPRPYALLISMGQPGIVEAEAAKKGGTKGGGTPTPTPDKCYSVVTNSNGDLVLDGEVPCK